MHLKSKADRLVEVDALRGVAALAVVLFHYTTRFTDLYQPGAQPAVSFPSGHYGVNLFFIISGFVIFMTLEKTARPLDFVVSRFSRLFPAYWAAIFLTFSICHLLGLPGKLVSTGTALANLAMLHGLFGVGHVDGVYWTLEVELLFYCGMLLLYRLKWLDRLHLVLFALPVPATGLLRAGALVQHRPSLDHFQAGDLAVPAMVCIGNLHLPSDEPPWPARLACACPDFCNGHRHAVGLRVNVCRRVGSGAGDCRVSGCQRQSADPAVAATGLAWHGVLSAVPAA